MLKYIVTRTEKGEEEMFLFPSHIDHDAFAEALECFRNQTHGNWERVYRKPISAGFVNTNGICRGSSSSLGLSSRAEDTELLSTQYKESTQCQNFPAK